jgi:hypothetical protein
MIRAAAPTAPSSRRSPPSNTFATTHALLPTSSGTSSNAFQAGCNTSATQTAAAESIEIHTAAFA